MSREATPPSKPRILCADDDSRVQRALARDLQGRGYEVTTASTAAEAARLCESDSFDAALVDLRLGEDDGIQLLGDLAQSSPNVLRLLLTGFGDYGESVRAINEGHVFAFLEKPWAIDALDDLIRAGLETHRTESEQAHLRDTSGVSATVAPPLAALLEGLRELEVPHKAGHHERLERMLNAFCTQLRLRPESIERVCLAARVHDIAETLVPAFATGTAAEGLTPADRRAWELHPDRAARILERSPGLASIAEIVRLHHEHHDGSGFPRGLAGEAIPVPVRVFAVADAYDELIHGGIVSPPLGEQAARERLLRDSGRCFDPRVVNVFLRWLGQRPAAESDEPHSDGVEVQALRPGMILAEDLLSPSGLLLVPAGHRLNDALIHRIMSLGEQGLWRKQVRLKAGGDTSAKAASTDSAQE